MFRLVGMTSWMKRQIQQITRLEYIYDTNSRRIKQINNADHTVGNPSSWLLYPTISQGLAISGVSEGIELADMDARYVDEEGNEIGFVTNRFGAMTSFTDALDAVTTYEFDEQGYLYRTTGADPDGTGSQTAPVTKFGYSDDGNLVYTEYADGTTSTASYHATLNLITNSTNELGDSESFTYDSTGNLLTHADLDGNVWTYTYDSYGNLLTETTPDPDGSGTLYSAIVNDAHVRFHVLQPADKDDLGQQRLRRVHLHV